jgi:hypothetical protein
MENTTPHEPIVVINTDEIKKISNPTLRAALSSIVSKVKNLEAHESYPDWFDTWADGSGWIDTDNN